MSFSYNGLLPKMKNDYDHPAGAVALGCHCCIHQQVNCSFFHRCLPCIAWQLDASTTAYRRASHHRCNAMLQQKWCQHWQVVFSFLNFCHLTFSPTLSFSQCSGTPLGAPEQGSLIDRANRRLIIDYNRRLPITNRYF